MLLLVSVETFTGWTEALPCRTEKASEVAKALLKEIIPRFGLPLTSQSDSRAAFAVRELKRCLRFWELVGSCMQPGDPSLLEKLKK